MRRQVLCWGALQLPGCTTPPSSDPLACVVPPDVATCEKLYPPTDEQVHAQTLVPFCGAAGCHQRSGDPGAGGGMIVSQAPETTLGRLYDSGFVLPGDAACSPLLVRVLTDDASLRMPPGPAGLDPRAICSLATWIEGMEQP